MQRTHLVLVPGFGGFDAFGDLRYYDRVSPLFQRWRDEHQPGHWEPADGAPVPWQAADRSLRAATVLHFFDNHPTAGVGLRAHLLGEFLAKRIVRGQIDRRDRIVLVGHSTGGLDVRALLHRCAQPGAAFRVDGGTAPVHGEELLHRIAGVVSLSAAHHGTNIADFLCDLWPLTRAVVAGLRIGVCVGGRPPPRIPRDQPTHRSGLVEVALDLLEVVRRRNQRLGRDATFEQRLDVARAEEVLGGVRTWLAHADRDRMALETLRVRKGPAAEPLADRLPGHTRALAFATRGPDAFPRPARHGSAPCRLREVLRRVRDGLDGGDVFYRAGWLICSAGPFAREGSAPDLDTGVVEPIRPWESDGVVNTASMLWPEGAATRLVRGDHGDIIGHYERVRRSDRRAPGRYEAYDLLGSGAPFGEAQFTRIWREVFDFAALAGN